MKTKLQKEEENFLKIQKTVESFENTSKSGKICIFCCLHCKQIETFSSCAGGSAADMKKEVERINKEIKVSIYSTLF